MGAQDPKGLLAIHTNMANAIPRAMDSAAFRGAPVPDGLSDDERQAYEQLAAFYRDPYYGFLMGTRPQTLTALTDSPVGLATFLIDHDRRSLELIARCFNGVPESGVKVPVAVSAFPDDLYQLPRSWAELAYPKLIQIGTALIRAAVGRQRRFADGRGWISISERD